MGRVLDMFLSVKYHLSEIKEAVATWTRVSGVFAVAVVHCDVRHPVDLQRKELNDFANETGFGTGPRIRIGKSSGTYRGVDRNFWLLISGWSAYLL